MSCLIKKTENNNHIEVYAPNGNKSQLFSDILSITGNQQTALNIWATAYSSDFIARYGDWVSLENTKRTQPDNDEAIALLQQNVAIQTDDNGEPSMMYLDIPGISFNAARSTRAKIEQFLSKIGVSVSLVSDILPDGAAAQADFLNKTIRVVSGMEDITTLPEEAAHFFVRLLPKDAPMRKEMFDKITSYPIYKTTLSQYAGIYRQANKPDFEKIKEEAIGKLIAQAIVNPDHVSTNRQEVKRASGWLAGILKYVKSLFSKVAVDPFIEAAQNILQTKTEGLDPVDGLRENDIMYQLSSGQPSETVFQTLRQSAALITKKSTTDPDQETGKMKEAYFVNGKQVKKRVTDLVKAYYGEIFHNQAEKNKREYFNILAEQGTKIHQDIENILSRYIGEDGLLLNIPGDKPSQVSTNQHIYSLLEENIAARLQALVTQYGDQTRFLYELKIFSAKEDMAGTIDLLVIKPNGRVDILDWKSMNIIPKYFSEIPWYKRRAYTIQLETYAKILKESGIDADLKRAVPIRMVMSQDGNKGPYNVLSGIEIGSHFVSRISGDRQYLLPVASEEERTGHEAVDQLISKIHSIQQQIRQQTYLPEEKHRRLEEINNLSRAVYKLQVSQSLDGVLKSGEIMLSGIQRLMESNQLDIKRAQLYFRQIRVYAELSAIVNLLEEESFGEPLTDEAKNQIYQLAGQAGRFEDKLKKFLLDKGNEVAAKVGVEGVTVAEKNLSWWASNIRSISGTATSAVRTFYKYLVDFQDAIYRSRDQNNDQLAKLKKKLEDWGKSKNIPPDKLFDGLLEFSETGHWKGTFLNKYDTKYWRLREQLLLQRDVAGLEKLYDLSAESKQKFETRKQTFLKWIQSTTFDTDEATDAKIREKRIEDWHFQYDVFSDKYRQTALLNPRNRMTGSPQYYSAKWLALQQDPILLEVYTYFQSLLTEGERMGIIDHAGSFIPSIENDKLDMWAQYGSQSIFKLSGFFNTFEYKTGTTWGELDPITGKPLSRLPRLFTAHLGRTRTDPVSGEDYQDFSLKSKDLFTVFSVWGKYMAEYKYMSQLEEVGNLMTLTETIKNKHLHRGANGKYEEIKGNDANTTYLQDFIDYYVYGRKLKDSSPWEFELFGKKYSGKRMVQGAIRYMGMKTLAFNTISIAANFIGGKFNTFFSASKGRFFNQKQWAQAEFALSSDKGKALVDFFDVFLEDTSYHKARQLSVHQVIRKLSYDNLFIGQRLTDKWVQYPVLIAMTRSYGVIDGEIKNIRHYVESRHKPTDFYSKTQQEQRKINADIESEVIQMEKQRSIWSLSSVKDGFLQIEGINREMPTVMQFRQSVKRANKIILGNSTGDDIARYRMSLLGQALGQFRNWMPAMADERFSELRYDEDSQAWTEGKIRSYFSNYFATETDTAAGQKIFSLLTRHMGVLVKDLVGLTSAGNIQARAMSLYAKRKAEAAEKGLNFSITEKQYVEMHYANVRSTISEMRLIVGFAGLLISLGASHDEEDASSKGIRRFITRTLDKFNNELLFYYNPINFTDLINSPIPVVGLSTDIFKFFGHLAGEGYGQVIGDQKAIDKYKPTKYILKDIPISRELYNLGTIFSEDMRRAYEVTN